MDKVYYKWTELSADIMDIVKAINRRKAVNSVYGVPRGGIPIAVAFSYTTGLPLMTAEGITEKTLILDDIIDSGTTRNRYPDNLFIALHRTVKSKVENDELTSWLHFADNWVVYPWETDRNETVEENVVRILQYIGEDPTREGLLETPHRVVRAYDEICAGYKQKPEDVIKTFSNSDNGNYEEIVLCKNVEIFSLCEHHMLPFTGKAHIAYIPNKLIIGLSKLARIVDMFAKRLQTQERLCGQVTETLMRHLDPHGAACIIQCEHLCMRMRGVGKQNSTMVTSSLEGIFIEDSDRGRAARAELMNLIKD